MKEPKRLLEMGSMLERSILAQGRDERPSGDVTRKTLAAMAATQLASAPLAPSRLRLPNPRALVTGAVAIGLAALVSASLSSRTAPPPSTPVMPRVELRAVAAPPAILEEPEPVVTPESLPNAAAVGRAPDERTKAPVRAVPKAAPIAGASIAREVELLDGVKSSLAGGDVAAAAGALDAYDAEFSAGSLRPEASVLRVRMLLARGDRAGAERLGRDFLAKHPTGIHAKRVRSLLAIPEGTGGE